MSNDEIKLTLKELKSKLEENQLDLSMHHLTSVPVKNMAKLSKAIYVDLSRNNLEVLSLDFSTLLIYIVKLDLSENRLNHLPDNFGNLTNLTYLDLYKNRIQDLPLSFSNLKQLKWLDLKDNPLVSNLAKVAGNCLNEKECKTAANNVVNYMDKMKADSDKLRERAEIAARELLSSNDNTNRMKSSTKKRNKEPRIKRNTVNLDGKAVETEKSTRYLDGFYWQFLPFSTCQHLDGDNLRNKSDRNRTRIKPNAPYLHRLCHFLLFFLLFSLIFCLLSAFILYRNCTDVDHWIPDSSDLCLNLYTWSKSGKIPKSTGENLLSSLNGLRNLIGKKCSHLVEYYIDNDWISMGEDVRNSTMQWTNKTLEWFAVLYIYAKTEFPPLLNIVWTQVKVSGYIMGELLILISKILIEISIDIFYWTIENLILFCHMTSELLIDLSEKYWQNIKLW